MSQEDNVKDTGQQFVDDNNDESGIKIYSLEDAEKLLNDSERLLESAEKNVDEAQTMCSRVGLSIVSSLTEDPIVISKMNSSNKLTTTQMLVTTGGHSNTDHIVPSTGDARADRINELKRNMKRQIKAFQPEDKGEERWDQPRIPFSGIRRRRITREKDLASAPPEPPSTGYFVYLLQMTYKIRYDRKVLYNRTDHDQAQITKYVSQLWGCALNKEERHRYNNFAKESRMEYDYQLRQFRATGYYIPSLRFEKMDPSRSGGGVWVKTNWEERNELEREISKYPTEAFCLKHDHRLKPLQQGTAI